MHHVVGEKLCEPLVQEGFWMRVLRMNMTLVPLAEAYAASPSKTCWNFRNDASETQ